MAWFKKKQRMLFGKGVEPSCAYCANNRGDSQRVLCALHGETSSGVCKSYSYDPLRRNPRPAPPLRADRYSAEDFKL